jgi:acyl-coenzyme A synthetase/AMP-(fatty) acid ligase
MKVDTNRGAAILARNDATSLYDPIACKSHIGTYCASKDGNYVYFAGDGARKDEDGYYRIM